MTTRAFDVEPFTGHRPGTPGYRRVVGALFAAGLATFALLYDTQAVLPELAAEFGVSATRSTLTVSLTTVGLAAALVLTGPWSDRVGRTRLIHLSLGGSALVAVACAVAPTWESLLVLRLAQGIALAGLPAVATAYLREELHPGAQARAAGLYIGGTALGGAAGRLVTGPVAEAWGWRWGLGAAAALAVVCTVVVAALLPRSRGFSARPAGLAAVVGSGRRAFADPALRALYVVGGCSVGSLVAVFNVLGFRLGAAPFDLGLGAVSLLFLVYPLGSLSSTVSGRVADRLGRRAVVPVGVGLAVLGLLLTLPDLLPLVVVGLAVFAVGFFAVHGVASGWVPVRAHAGAVSAGQAASLYLVSYYVGSSVFGGLAGQAYAWSGWSGVVVQCLLLWAVVAGCVRILRRTPSLLA